MSHIKTLLKQKGKTVKIIKPVFEFLVHKKGALQLLFDL